MALTYTKTIVGDVYQHAIGDLTARLVEFDCTKYAAAGVPVTAAEMGMSDVLAAFVISSENARAFKFARADNTIHAYVLTTAAEVADDADLGTFIALVLGH